MAKLKTVIFVGAVAGGTAWLLTSKAGRVLRERWLGSGGSQPADDFSDFGDERSEELRRKIEETRRRLREQVGLPPEG